MVVKGLFFFLVITFFILHIKSWKIQISLFFIFIFTRIYSESLISHFSNYPMLVRIFGLDESSSITAGTSSSARVSLLSESFSSISNNPLGYGLGNFAIYSDESSVLGPTGYPHNFFVEVWLESGIQLLLIVIVYFIYISVDVYNKLYKNSNELNPTKKSIIALWIFYLLNSMVSGDLSDARFLIVFTAVYFILIITNRKNHL